jgi:HAD superfamily, subfamily IIIB (Acid phosphatase)
MTGKRDLRLANRETMGGVKSRAAIIAALLLMFVGSLTPARAAPAGCDPVPTPPHVAASRPPNLGALKLTLIAYRCTRYDAEVARVLHDARAWIERRAGRHRAAERPALVLDIDETSLSNWKQIYQNDFGYIVKGDCDFAKGSACGQIAWEQSARAEAITPTLDLFNAAKARQVTVFFITGRHEGPDERTATEANLHNVGYDGWQRLYMRTNAFDGPSVAPFKTWARQDIERQGYTIIANVGDQQSDLANGHAERRFKVPNPFYYIQ